jgi:MFS family permease
MLGQAISNVGNYMTAVVLPLQVLALGFGAGELAAVLAVGEAVHVALLVVAGPTADRMSRRRVIVAAEFVGFVGVGGLSALGFSGSLTLLHLVAGSAVLSASSAFLSPALPAYVADVVPTSQLASGNALRGLSRQFGGAVGPILAALIVGSAGPPTAFAVDAASFILSSVLVASVAERRTSKARRQALRRDIVEGWHYVLTNRWLRVSIPVFALTSAAISAPLSIALPVLAANTLNAPALYGAIVSANGTGKLAAGLFVGTARLPASAVAAYGLAIAASVAVAAIGLLAAVPTVLLFSFILGAALFSFDVVWSTLLQTHVPGPLLGRVFAIDNLGGSALSPAAPLLGAAAVVVLGAPSTLLVGGLVAVACCVVGLTFPSVRKLR